MLSQKIIHNIKQQIGIYQQANTSSNISL